MTKSSHLSQTTSDPKNKGTPPSSTPKVEDKKVHPFWRSEYNPTSYDHFAVSRENRITPQKAQNDKKLISQ